MKCSINYRQHEVGISANDFVGSCGKAIYSFMSVPNSVYRGGIHVTSTHDALDLMIQHPSPCHPLCWALLSSVHGSPTAVQFPGATPF